MNSTHRVLADAPFRFVLESAPHPPPASLTQFRNSYGPTLNAFEAAEKSRRSVDLQRELETLFVAQNRSSTPEKAVIPATFLRVTVVR